MANAAAAGLTQGQSQNFIDMSGPIKPGSIKPGPIKPGPIKPGRVTRDDIVDAIREVKITPGQQLRHVEVSQDIYDMANKFARWAPNFGTENQPYRFKMDSLYLLLQSNITSKTLQETPEEVEGWQSACKALLRYALNLLLAPKRPEFRRLKLSSSFYVYQVLRKLPRGAEKILVSMGYKPTSQDMQELKYEGDVNTERVLETATDLVILHSELDLIKQLVGTAINQSQCDPTVANLVTLHKILDARAVSNEKYDDAWRYLMKAAYTPQDVKNQLSQPRNLSHGRPSSDITAYRSTAENQFPGGMQGTPDVRRGSTPALNQWSDNQASDIRSSALNQDLCRGSVPVSNSQSQFQVPNERLLESAGSSHPSPSWHHMPQHAASHQWYPSSGPQVLAPLQSRDPSTAALDPNLEIDHQNLHNRQAVLSGPAAVPQSPQQCQLVSSSAVEQNPQHYHNMPFSTATTSSGECKHVQSTHQSQSPTDDSSSHYQNVLYVTQVTASGSEIELAQSSRGENGGLYANISETAVCINQGASTGQSPTAGHKQHSPQEARGVRIRGATPKVHTSVSSRSFQEELHNLYKQFPDLVEGQDEGQEEGPAPSASDPTYQNISDMLQLEGETEQPQESLVPDSQFPEPVVQSEAELEQLERCRRNRNVLMSINPVIKDTRSVFDDDDVGPCYDSLSPPDRSLVHTPSTQDQQEINDAWTVRTETHPVTQLSIGAGDEGSTCTKPGDRRSPMTSQDIISPDDIKLEVSDRLPSHSSSGTEDIYESASGSAGASLEQEPSLTSPRYKPAESSGSASVEHETLTTGVAQPAVPRVVADYDENSLSELQPPKSSRPTLPHQGTIPESDSKPKPIPKPRSKLQEMHNASKSLDNALDEPKSPQPKPRPRGGLMRNVKSASDLQQLGEQQHSGGHHLDVPTVQPEEDEGGNVTPGEVQPTTCDAQTGQQDGVQQNWKPVFPPHQPSQGASTEIESILSDNEGESVNMEEPVATGTVIGEERRGRELHLYKDRQEYPVRPRPPTSPLQRKTSATVFESNVMAHNPVQVPVKRRVTTESSLDFGGERANKSHQKKSSSSRTENMPSPQELVVGQTDLVDPAVEGFWCCSYCTNLVSNSLVSCDVCGGSKDSV